MAPHRTAKWYKAGLPKVGGHEMITKNPKTFQGVKSVCRCYFEGRGLNILGNEALAEWRLITFSANVYCCL